MNKQELKESIEQLPTILGWQCNGAKVIVAKDSVLELVRRLDEPQKVVIPPLIAGYLVHCQFYSMTLARALTRPEDSCEDNVAPDVRVWLSRKENQEAFVRAWLDGYEVEQEKVYTVKIPNPHHDGITVLEKVGDDVIMSQMDDYLTDWQKEPEYQLTAAEIRKDFDWAWQWAEEVKEVEWEKLYTVEIPDPDKPNGKKTNLAKFKGKVFLSSTVGAAPLTEAEIKRNHAWAWQAGFAKIVEENEK